MADTRRWSALVAGVVGGVVGAGVMAGVTATMGQARQGSGWGAYFAPAVIAPSTAADFIISPAFGDWDGDGDSDLVALAAGLGSGMQIALYDNQDGSFLLEEWVNLADLGLAPVVGFEVDYQWTHVVQDINSDGVNELIVLYQENAPSGARRIAVVPNPLAPWQPNPSRAADLNRDGMVGSEDIALLLGAWGPVKPAQEAK